VPVWTDEASRARQAFDNEVKEMVTSNKLSASRVKKVTDAAMDNISVSATPAPVFRTPRTVRGSQLSLYSYLFLPALIGRTHGKTGDSTTRIW